MQHVTQTQKDIQINLIDKHINVRNIRIRMWYRRAYLPTRTTTNYPSYDMQLVDLCYKYLIRIDAS